MGIKVKQGGAWQGPVADGNLRVKYNGAWYAPGYAYVKSGGGWVDTGYRGTPWAPSGIWVAAWDYTQTLVQWHAPPDGGPAIDAWHVERRDVNGTPVEGYIQTQTDKTFKTPQDTRHQFYVRSRGANGLYSAWTGPLRVGIGHPETYNYGYVTRTRPWSTGMIGVMMYRDTISQVLVPASVGIDAFHFDLYANGGWTSSISPGTNRKMSHIFNSTDQGDTMSAPNPYQTVESGYGGQSGNGLYWGIVLRGSGWFASNGAHPENYIGGAYGLSGTETYQNYEVVSTNPAQGNYYW